MGRIRSGRLVAALWTSKVSVNSGYRRRGNRFCAGNTRATVQCWRQSLCQGVCGRILRGVGSRGGGKRGSRASAP